MNRFIEKFKSNRTALLICFLLALMVWAVFGQTLGHEFVDYDDDGYVYKNPDVSQGLSATGIRLACTRIYSANWHPVTIVSYLSDYELFGLNPSGYHLTNVLLHIATSISLFLVLRSITGSLWRSALVAMLFAIHPLRVESVAWISERKDVLSGFFFMLCLGAYARYTKRVARGGPWWRVAGGSYMMVVVFLILGLMSKAMLVTLPFVLLLLDFWPLCRFSPAAAGSGDGAQTPSRLSNGQSFRRLIAEKIPLLLISVFFCGVTMRAQQDVFPLSENLPVLWRVGNALCSYVTYIGQTLFPAGLAAFYPHPGTSLPLWKIAASLILLIVISLAVFIMRRKRPYLMTGWLWYTGMLVPVIGLIQVGQQAHADRYMYLPQIGLFILLVWLVAEGFTRRPHRRLAVGTTVTALLAALMAGAWIQTLHWHDNRVLWEHTLAHTTANSLAHYNLGVTLQKQGKPEAAIEHFQQALMIKPNDAEAHYNLGVILGKQGKLEASIEQFQQTLMIKPDYAQARNNLGSALYRQGKLEAASEQYQRALQIKPDYVQASNALKITTMVLMQGRQGAALTLQGRLGEAVRCLERVLAICPENADAQNNLAWILATAPDAALRDGPRAVELATAANRSSGGGNASFLDTLAAACAEAGRYPEAVDAARRALDMAAGQEVAAGRISARLRLYEAGLPYHEPEKKNRHDQP